MKQTRRGFLKTSSAIVAGAAANSLPISSSAHAASNNTIKVGLIGCGGRGTGAAAQAMQADPDVRLVYIRA
jgi:hypothetical protein